jgi:hypothetical protein
MSKVKIKYKKHTVTIKDSAISSKRCIVTITKNFGLTSVHSASSRWIDVDLVEIMCYIDDL